MQYKIFFKTIVVILLCAVSFCNQVDICITKLFPQLIPHWERYIVYLHILNNSFLLDDSACPRLLTRIVIIQGNNWLDFHEVVYRYSNSYNIVTRHLSAEDPATSAQYTLLAGTASLLPNAAVSIGRL